MGCEVGKKDSETVKTVHAAGSVSADSPDLAHIRKTKTPGDHGVSGLLGSSFSPELSETYRT